MHNMHIQFIIRNRTGHVHCHHLLELARFRPVHNFVVLFFFFFFLDFYYFVIKIIEAHTFFILKMVKTNENRHINADGGQFFNSNFFLDRAQHIHKPQCYILWMISKYNIPFPLQCFYVMWFRNYYWLCLMGWYSLTRK